MNGLALNLIQRWIRRQRQQDRQDSMRHNLSLLLGILFPLLVLALATTALSAVADQAQAVVPGARILKSDSDQIVFSLQTGPIVVDTSGIVTAPGLDRYLNRPGEPILPFFSTYIALPPGAVVSVNVSRDHLTRLETSEVLAAPAAESAYVAPSDLSGLPSIDERRLLNLPNPGIYQATGSYPEALFHLSEPMYMRDLRVVQLDLFPVRYSPAAAVIEHASNLEITVHFEGAQEPGRAVPTPDGSFADSIEALVLNHEQAQVWRGLPENQSVTNTALPVGVDVYKIEVNEDGIYEVTYSDLQAAGMDVDAVNPQTFQMLYRGEPVAYEFIGDGDTQFEVGEKVRFYGWEFDGSRLEKQFFVNNVYWLWASGTPTTISSITAQNGYPSAVSWLSSITWEPENIWFASHTDQWDSFPNEPDAWYADQHTKNSALPSVRQYPITLPHPAASGTPATFTAEYSSRPNPVVNGVEQPHVIEVYLNNDPNYGTATWYGKRNVNITSTVPLTRLISGTNTFDAVLATIAATTSPENVFLNRLTVDYQRQFIAANDQLIFSDEVGGQRRFDIQGFSQNNPDQVVVWDVTNKTGPVKITGAAVSGSGPYTYMFGSDHPAGAEFIATTTANTLSPIAVSQYVVNDIDPVAGADWVAISYSDFIAEIAVLANHRTNSQFGGYSTHVVDIEDVVNQYGYGLPIPKAIRDYMIHALNAWPIAPTYLTLVGDATVNPRNNLNNGGAFSEPQYVLTDLAFVDRYQGQIPSDFTFSLLIGQDNLPDIAVGRFPVRTAAEAAAVVDKIILYEQNQLDSEAWMENLLFAADNTDSGGNFCAENQMVGEHIPDHFNQVHLCLPDNPTTADAQIMRDQIFNYVNNTGITVLNYRGHGAIATWAGAPVIMTTANVADFSNPQKPIVIASADCLDGYFIYPLTQGLGETFLRAEGKGSAAHWSSSGLGLSSEHSVLIDNFYLGLFSVGQTSLGAATNYAKMVFAIAGGHRSILYSFILEGDPAMQFMRPDLQVQKNALTSQAEPGDMVEFAIQVANNGIYPGHVTLTDTLPSQMTFITATSSITTAIQTVGNQIFIDLQNGSDQLNRGLPWNATATVTITAQVDIPAGIGDKTNNVVAGGTGLELSPTDNYDSAVVHILNVPPLAANDHYTVTENTLLTVPAPGVLSNDTDANGQVLFASLVTGPAHGSLALNADGSFTYLPNNNYSGMDSFTYQALDGIAQSNVATVTLTIDDVNSNPVANDNIYGSSSTTLIVAAPGVLGNDTDPDGDPLTASLESNPTHGSVVLNADGSFTYNAPAGFRGVDSFIYRASDGRGGYDLATVYIIVQSGVYLPLVLFSSG
jgi:uncharacterized repeat protein (TIGR01451 family)